MQSDDQQVGLFMRWEGGRKILGDEGSAPRVPFQAWGPKLPET